MKWFKNEDLEGAIISESKPKKESMTIRFGEKGKKKSVNMYLNKAFINHAKDKGLTHMRFGIDNKLKRIMIQLNDKEQGYYLLNKKEEYRYIINVKGLVALLTESNIEIEIDKVIELEEKDGVTFFFNYENTVKLNEKEKNEAGQTNSEVITDKKEENKTKKTDIKEKAKELVKS